MHSHARRNLATDWVLKLRDGCTIVGEVTNVSGNEKDIEIRREALVVAPQRVRVC